MRASISTSADPVMIQFTSPSGRRISFQKSGSGPALVLVHGGFSDHHTNWEFVEPILRERFTVYAVARRNRGTTEATEGHSLVGSESYHDLYVTNALASALPHARLQLLHGQAHEGMTTAPEMYAEAVTTFLLE